MATSAFVPTTAEAAFLEPSQGIEGARGASGRGRSNWLSNPDIADRLGRVASRSKLASRTLEAVVKQERDTSGCLGGIDTPRSLEQT
jgi:hypothetical protein